MKLWADKICLLTILVFLWCAPSVAQENASFKLYFSLVRKALQNNDFNAALNYFTIVKERVSEDSDVRNVYLDLITLRNSPVSSSLKERVIENIDFLDQKYSDFDGAAPANQAASASSYQSTQSKPAINTTPKQRSSEVDPLKDKSSQESGMSSFRERLYGKKYLFYLNKVRPIDQRIRDEESQIESFEVKLDDELWATQPKTEISVKVGQTVVLKTTGSIKRFLSTRPELLSLKKIDEQTLEVNSQTTVVVPIYIWDERGRWTINVRGFSRATLYRQLSDADADTRNMVLEDTFKFRYSANGTVRYAGQSLSALDSTGSRSLNSLSVEGPSPYGRMDSGLDWGADSGNNQITYFTMGLTDGDIGWLEDFNLRLFDFSANLTPHIFGYSSLRGTYFDKSFLKDRFKWTSFYGKERSLSVVSLSQSSQDRDVNYTGTKLEFFDQHNGRYGLNYIERGGQDITGATDQAYGFDFNKKIKSFVFGGELATDKDQFAKTFNGGYHNGRYGTNINLYNIDEEYKGVTGAVGDQGRIGAKWDGSVYVQKKFDLHLGTNVYKERTFSEEDRKDNLNYENFLSYSMPLSETLNFSTTNIYNDLSGGFAPSKYFNNNNSLSKNFMLFNKRSDASLNVGYNQNRSEIDASSDYNRYVFGTGLNIQLNERLVWSNNYQYNIQKDLSTGLISKPASAMTSLAYNKRINDRVKVDWRTSYKKELSQSDSPNFFAPGDRFSLAAGINYKPAPEVTTYLQGEWNQDINSDSQDATEFNIKWGLEANWDSVISWSPKGIVEGVVYKDMDGNDRQDENEPGLPGMVIMVGDKNYITDSEGRFATYVRAKRVKVMLKNENFPKGYNYSDSLIKKVEILHGGIQTLFFPLTSNTALLGQVFLDENNNGILDRNEQCFRGVNVTVDGESQKTDYKGSFLFASLNAGKHKLRIDVNSLPADYIPKAKIQQTFDLMEGDTQVMNIPLVEKEKK